MPLPPRLADATQTNIERLIASGEAEGLHQGFQARVPNALG